VPDDGTGPSAGGVAGFGAGDPGAGVNAQVIGLASGRGRVGIGGRSPAIDTGALSAVVGEVTDVGEGDVVNHPPPALASGSRRKPG
jgi:hypothetical protein